MWITAKSYACTLHLLCHVRPIYSSISTDCPIVLPIITCSSGTTVALLYTLHNSGSLHNALHSPSIIASHCRSATFHWFFMHITQQYTPPQGYPHLSSCMVAPPQKSFLLALSMIHLRTNPSYMQKWPSYVILWRHITETQHLQRSSYDHGTPARDFCVGDPIWVSIPTTGKLDPG